MKMNPTPSKPEMKDDRSGSKNAARLNPGIFSIILGMLAILSVIEEYEILSFMWLGHESWILSRIFLFLPGAALALAIVSLIESRAGLKEKGREGVFGVIGMVISKMSFLCCGLLFSFFCKASGGLMGL
jgi:hypothetical protein